MVLTRRAFVMSAAAPLLAQRTGGLRPNIVLLIAESLPAHALGCYGNREIRTPGLDLLARGGARFTFHATASPAPAPGLASLLSGLTPRQHGVGDTPGQNGAGFSKARLLSHQLSAAGYSCGFAGRWDLGGGEGQNGFHYWRPLPGSGQGFAAEKVTQDAVGFLDQQKAQQPFLLVASYPDPGDSYDGRPQKYYDMYAETAFTTAGWQPAAANAAQGKEYLSDIVASLKRCAAAITALDDQVRELVAAIDKRGHRDQTLVIFTSSCGNLMGRHGLWGAGRASDPINMYEESVMTPMIWNWPTRVPVESVRPELVDGCDLLPTLCEVAGVKLPEGTPLAGRSYLLSALNKPYPAKQPWRNLVFSHLDDTEMVRDLRFKLVLRKQGQGPNELYDVRRDPGETDNEFETGNFVTVAEALGGELSNWRKTYR